MLSGSAAHMFIIRSAQTKLYNIGLEEKSWMSELWNVTHNQWC